MTVDGVHALFVLFSGELDLEKYQPLIDIAMTEVENKLREDADINDTRLEYLAASIANFNYSQITCLKNKVAYTYAGTADCKGNSQMEYDFAKELMREYYAACADLLIDNAFVFESVGS